MINAYSKEEIDEIERIFFKSVQEDIECCADMGICNHDAEWIVEQRRLLKTHNFVVCYGKTGVQMKAIEKRLKCQNKRWYHLLKHWNGEYRKIIVSGVV